MSTVLIVGGGGREHAIAWKLSQSPHVSRMILAPGNPGMPDLWEKWEAQLNEGRSLFGKLADRAKQSEVDLVVIGPDNPLADGIVDVFQEKGLLCFGPTSRASQIEASKVFAKKMMVEAGVPTASYWVLRTVEEAQKFIESLSWRGRLGWVLKADGLAYGKGVYVCRTVHEALSALNHLSKISNQIIVEECLSGEEVSWMGFCDGEQCALLAPVRDYKRLLDSNLGPNTGGMGAFCPVPGLTHSLEKKIKEQVFLPILRQLKKVGAEFRGLLYAGLMISADSQEFWVLEFNARFGDPEAQVLLPRMKDDLYLWLEASAQGKLNSLPDQVDFCNESAVYVVAASEDYPSTSHFPSSKKIEEAIFFEDSVKENCFFSNVQKSEEGLIPSGGRILGVLGQGSDLDLARRQAYDHLKKIHFKGMQFRTDIGKLS